jgi:hypothetical protein
MIKAKGRSSCAAFTKTNPVHIPTSHSGKNLLKSSRQACRLCEGCCGLKNAHFLRDDALIKPRPLPSLISTMAGGNFGGAQLCLSGIKRQPQGCESYVSEVNGPKGRSSGGRGGFILTGKLNFRVSARQEPMTS